MNSRDAAYDEEELIRRAIEESKEDTKSITDEAAPRLNKRSRSESESYVALTIPMQIQVQQLTIAVLEIDKAPNAREPPPPPPRLSPSRASHPPSLRPMTSQSQRRPTAHEDREQLLEASATRNLPKSLRSRSLKSPKLVSAGKSDLTGAREMVSVPRIQQQRVIPR
jgi:hypothetical protein